jgi:hypothetical protein
MTGEFKIGDEVRLRRRCRLGDTTKKYHVRAVNPGGYGVFIQPDGGDCEYAYSDDIEPFDQAKKCFGVTFTRCINEDMEQIESLKKIDLIRNISETLSQSDQLLAFVQFLKEFDDLKGDFRIIGQHRNVYINYLKFKDIQWSTEWSEIRINVDFFLTDCAEPQKFVDEIQRVFYNVGWMPGNFVIKE